MKLSSAWVSNTVVVSSSLEPFCTPMLIFPHASFRCFWHPVRAPAPIYARTWAEALDPLTLRE